MEASNYCCRVQRGKTVHAKHTGIWRLSGMQTHQKDCKFSEAPGLHTIMCAHCEVRNYLRGKQKGKRQTVTGIVGKEKENNGEADSSPKKRKRSKGWMK